VSASHRESPTASHCDAASHRNVNVYGARHCRESLTQTRPRQSPYLYMGTLTRVTRIKEAVRGKRIRERLEI